MNLSDSNWAILSLIFLPPVSSEKQMPFKRLMIIIGIVLMLLLMIFAITTESHSAGISGVTSTGIHEATWTGNIEVIKQLIASDIDVNVRRNRGDTPLHIAARFSRYEIANLLI